MSQRRRSAGLAIAVLILLPFAAAAAPQTSRACRLCRTQCPAEVTSCAEADPRLASCAPKRQGFCLRRAKRACKRNLKKCCLHTCRETGQVLCCGSALAPVPTTSVPPLESTTTTTSSSPSTTSTLPTTGTPCTTDTDCPSCGCCDLQSHTCSGATGPSAAVCCNPAGPSTVLQQGICGPKTPAVCPAQATCAPPGTNVGGTEYACQWCVGSGAIIEQFYPSNALPLSYPSNGCMRQ